MAKKLFVVVAVLAFTTSSGLGSIEAIQGVWRIVEQTVNHQTLRDTTLGAGFHIYAARHFAVVRETGEPPRPGAGDVDRATVAQLLATWGPFVAQAGTYELSGDRLIATILVAKNPENVTGKAGAQRFRSKEIR